MVKVKSPFSAAPNVLAALAVVAALAASGVAKAEPLLQLYIEGATYDLATETWIAGYRPEGLKLWVIGNVGGPGGKGTIKDVKLIAAYDNSLPVPAITLTPNTTGGYGGYADPSAPGATSLVADGLGTPKMNSGASLPSHGEYGSDTAYQMFALGDFALMDSPLGDFINTAGDDSIPDPSSGLQGQINVYTLMFAPSMVVHFDAFGTVCKPGSHKKSVCSDVFAPFSHDAEDPPPPVPEPASLALLGLGLAGLAIMRRRRAA